MRRKVVCVGFFVLLGLLAHLAVVVLCAFVIAMQEEIIHGGNVGRNPTWFVSMNLRGRSRQPPRFLTNEYGARRLPPQSAPSAAAIDNPRVNDSIRISPVRLVAADGEPVGVVSLDAAKGRAAEAQLDLVTGPAVPSNPLRLRTRCPYDAYPSVNPDQIWNTGLPDSNPFNLAVLSGGSTSLRIWRIAAGSRHVTCPSTDCALVADGFTSIMSLAFGPDGTLYVVEFDEDGWLGVEIGAQGGPLVPSAGGTVSACDVLTGACAVLAAGLSLPAAVAVDVHVGGGGRVHPGRGSRARHLLRSDPPTAGYEDARGYLLVWCFRSSLEWPRHFCNTSVCWSVLTLQLAPIPRREHGQSSMMNVRSARGCPLRWNSSR